ncbi:hypothetical protein BH09ACT12_BH09ACT12_30110 [soil metagenome]
MRVFNTPFAPQLEAAFGFDFNPDQGEIYTIGWGGHPEERNRLYAFLRENEIIDNIALKQAAMAVNPHLRYFNWKAEYGHTMIFLRPDRGIIESWQTPQRERSDHARLLAQFRTMIGRPHLAEMIAPTPTRGPDRGRLAPRARTMRIKRR